MADWYVSSAAYSGATAFATSHAYIIGDFVKPTSPVGGARWIFRCTTAGTSSTEPTWNTSNNGTSTSGTAVFTNVTGQSGFFWTAAAGDVPTVLVAPRIAAGDRVFLSSDHSETFSSGQSYGNITQSFGSNIKWISVNRAGSTPPVAADIAAGATITNSSSGHLAIFTGPNMYWSGVNFIMTGTSSFNIGNTGFTGAYFYNCTFYLNTSNSNSTVFFNATSSQVPVTWDNTTVQFGNAGQTITADSGTNTGGQLLWINTAAAIPGATFPTSLFSTQGNNVAIFTCRGLDLSALTTTLVKNSNSRGEKYLLDSCKIAPSVSRYNTTSVTNTRDLVELTNCFDGTNTISELYGPNGNLTTETTITLTGGAQDNVGVFSHKMVSNANADKFVYPFSGFWMDVENTSTGSSKTATVEIISSTALNNDEIALYLEYMGTVGSSVASFADCFAGPLATPTAVTTSTATWNSSPATPAKQKLQVTFTPHHAGRVRGQVRLGKTSATVYVNPQITIT